MTRAHRDYTRRVAVQANGFDPDTPVAGYYRTRLRSGAVFVGVRIWFGQPLDPVTYQPLDRSLRWCAAVNGKPVELDLVWPRCAGNPISASEYAYLMTLQDWAQDHAPDTPIADPMRRVDPLQSPILF